MTLIRQELLILCILRISLENACREASKKVVYEEHIDEMGEG